MKIVHITKIEIDSEGFLTVSPGVADNSVYEQVYRAAMGVYWNIEQQHFHMKKKDEWACTRQFRNILEAVKSELGITLELSKDIKWESLELEHQLAITSLFGKQHDWLEIEKYIQLDYQENRVVVITYDMEMDDLVDDFLIEVDFDTAWMREETDKLPEQYEHHLSKEVTYAKAKDIFGTIDPSILNWVWELNNHPLDETGMPTGKKPYVEKHQEKNGEFTQALVHVFHRLGAALYQVSAVLAIIFSFTNTYSIVSIIITALFIPAVFFSVWHSIIKRFIEASSKHGSFIIKGILWWASLATHLFLGESINGYLDIFLSYSCFSPGYIFNSTLSLLPVGET